MSKTSTNNDIVKYIYNELEEPNTLKLNFKAIIDNQVKDEISSYFEVKSYLDCCFETPSDRVINKIKKCVLKHRKEKVFKSL